MYDFMSSEGRCSDDKHTVRLEPLTASRLLPALGREAGGGRMAGTLPRRRHLLASDTSPSPRMLLSIAAPSQNFHPLPLLGRMNIPPTASLSKSARFFEALPAQCIEINRFEDSELVRMVSCAFFWLLEGKEDYHQLRWRRGGIGTVDVQKRFVQDVTRQVLEELDRLYGIRSEALRPETHQAA
jgi:hypothetical protein